MVKTLPPSLQPARDMLFTTHSRSFSTTTTPIIDNPKSLIAISNKKRLREAIPRLKKSVEITHARWAKAGPDKVAAAKAEYDVAVAELDQTERLIDLITHKHSDETSLDWLFAQYNAAVEQHKAAMEKYAVRDRVELLKMQALSPSENKRYVNYCYPIIPQSIFHINPFPRIILAPLSVC